MTHKKIIILFALIFLVSLISIPSAEAGWWQDTINWVKDLFGFSTEEAVLYLEKGDIISPYFTDIKIDENKRIYTIYSFPKNVYEDEIWKDYTEARSLKDKEGWNIKYLENDGIYDLEIEDFNYTSIKLRPYIKDENEKNKEISLKKNGIEQKKIKLNSLDKWDSPIEEFSVENILANNFTFGEHSTTIEITANATEEQDSLMNWGVNSAKNFGADGLMVTGFKNSGIIKSIIRFNLTLISGSVIDAKLNITLYSIDSIGGDEDHNISRVLKEWGEGTGTGVGENQSGAVSWDDARSAYESWTVDGCSAASTDCAYIYGGEGIENGAAGGSLILNGSEFDAVVEGWVNRSYNNYGVVIEMDYNTSGYYNFYTKEDASVQYRPVMIVEYTPNTAPTDPANIMINSTSLAQGNYSNEDLACSWDCADIDADTINFYNIVFKDGAEQFTLTGTCSDSTRAEVIIDSENTSIGEEWNCGVIYDDGSLNNTGGYIYTENLTILNAVPNSATNLKINATTDDNYTADDVYAEFRVGSEPEGDAVVYNITWYKNGLLNVTFGNLTNATSLTLETLESENTTQRDDWDFSIITCDIPTYACSSEVFSANITIRSIPPTIPTLQIPLNNSHIGNSSVELFCNDSTDADGDTIYYDIYADTNNPPTTQVNNSVDGIFNYTTEGDIWFRCRANDSTEYSSYTEPFYFHMDSGRLYNATMGYSESVQEGNLEIFSVNITINKLTIDNIWANLTYNGTDYSATRTTLSDQTYQAEYQFTTTFNIPSVPDDSELKGYWNFTELIINGDYEINDTYSFTHNVNSIGIFNCIDSGTNATQVLALNFTAYYETNKTKIDWSQVENDTSHENETGFDLDLNMIIWNNDITINKTLYLEATNVTEYDVCINPPNATFNIESMVEYSKAGFDARNYYFHDTTISNQTKEINLYLLEQIFANNIEFLVYDADNIEVSGAYITIERYDVANDNYYTIAMGRTNKDGKDNIYLRKNDAWYRFSVQLGASTVYIDTQARKIVDDIIVLYTSTTSLGEDLTRLRNMEFTLINTTDQIILTYNDPSGTASKNCLSVIVTNTTRESYVCAECQTAVSGTITCYIGNLTSGVIYAAYYSSASPGQVIGFISVALSGHLFPDLGKTGLMGAFFIILTFGLIGASMRRVSTTVIFTMIGVLFCMILGFIKLNPATSTIIFISMAIGGIILIILAKN